MTVGHGLESGESQKQPEPLPAWLLPLASFGLVAVLLAVYYWPCLIGTGELYISDLTFYFQPFCQFIGRELRAGILPLWNPYFYSGMSQLAVPSPALFYPPSFILFLLPFSLGLSIYMILHQLIGAVGTFMFLRRVGASAESSCFAAIALSLCAYNFTLIQNFTLPATICWLPLALYFCEGAARGEGSKRRAFDLLGLTLTTSMIVLCGRPEVGVPALVILTTLALAHFFFFPPTSAACGSVSGSNSAFVSETESGISKSATFSTSVPEAGIGTDSASVIQSSPARAPESGAARASESSSTSALKSSPTLSESSFRRRFLTLLAVGISMFCGILLAAPVLLPGIEWASLSPRAQGLEAKWVLLWSSNWYDWLGIVLANPLGSLYQLNETAAQLRHLVLSRGGSIPFVGSSYISTIVFTFAIFGFFSNRKKLLLVLGGMLLVSFLMASGSATPFAPSIIKLSPAFSAFRYPVKLVIVPCLVLILLAVLGIELVRSRELPSRAPKAMALLWTVLLVGGIVAYNVPSIAPMAAKWLVTGKVSNSILQMVRVGFSAATINASVLGLITCAVSFYCLKQKISFRLGVLCLSVLMAGNLLWASMSIRQIGWAPYFSDQLYVAEQIENQRRDLKISKHSRMVNLYFDPLTVPPEYDISHMGKDQRFFTYAREMLLHNIAICGNQQSSFGYEAAETKDYKDYFNDALFLSSQHRRAQPKTMCDRPLHRFAQLTATEIANTQIKRGDKILPLLDPSLFKLVKEDKAWNYRMYRVKSARAKFYFASRVVPVESFADLKKVILEREIVPQTTAFDSNPQIVYVLNRDFYPHKEIFEAINDRFKSGSDNAPASCEVTSQTSQSLSLKVQTDHDGLLYMADHFYPGWIAELDAKPVAILRANGLNRAVMIPKGEHVLKVSYHPFVLSLGFMLAGAGLLITAIVIFFVLKFGRESKPIPASGV